MGHREGGSVPVPGARLIPTERLAANTAFAYGIFAGRGGRRWQQDPDVSIADGGLTVPFVMNHVAPLRAELDVASVARRADAFFDGRPYQIWDAWAEHDWSPQGFARRSQPPAMVRPADAERAPAPADLEIAEVVDAAGIRSFERTLISAFEMKRVSADLPGILFAAAHLGDPRVRFWLGSVAGEPVATAWSSVSDGLVGIYGVATKRSMRGRGYGTAVTRAAIDARADLPAYLQATVMGLPVYERMGFERVGLCSVWQRPESAQA